MSFVICNSIESMRVIFLLIIISIALISCSEKETPFTCNQKLKIRHLYRELDSFKKVEIERFLSNFDALEKKRGIDVHILSDSLFYVTFNAGLHGVLKEPITYYSYVKNCLVFIRKKDDHPFTTIDYSKRFIDLISCYIDYDVTICYQLDLATEEEMVDTYEWVNIFMVSGPVRRVEIRNNRTIRKTEINLFMEEWYQYEKMQYQNNSVRQNSSYDTVVDLPNHNKNDRR